MSKEYEDIKEVDSDRTISTSVSRPLSPVTPVTLEPELYLLPIVYDLVADLSSKNRNDILRKEYLIKTDSKELIKLDIKNWKYNRPVDKNRIPEIFRCYQNEGFIDGILYIAKIRDEYYIYDGVHRLNTLYKFPTNKVVIIHLFVDVDDNTLIERFTKINQTNPVSELYIENAKEPKKNDIKNIIENLVSYYSKNYNSFFSGSNNPRVPNITKVGLTSMLYDLTTNYEHSDIFNTMNYELWHDFLNIKNDYMKEIKNTLKLTAKQEEKCRKAGLYLFASKDWSTRDNSLILKGMGYDV